MNGSGMGHYKNYDTRNDTIWTSFVRRIRPPTYPTTVYLKIKRDSADSTLRSTSLVYFSGVPG